MAGSYIKTVDEIRNYGYGPKSQRCRVVSYTWTADASDASVPAIPVSDVHGFIIKVITSPGGTAPTDGYNVYLYDADFPTLDTFNGDLTARANDAVEEIYPVGVEGATPVFVCPSTTQSLSLEVKDNVVNSAIGSITIYTIDG